MRRSYDKQASVYASRKLLQTSNLRRLLSLLYETRPAASHGRLVDVGCGDGVFLEVLADTYPAFEYDYLGVDLSRGMIDAAIASHGNADRFVVGDADRLPVDDDSVDVVLSNSVLHWLNVPEEGLTIRKAIREIQRVLKPGGVAAVSVSAVGTAAVFLRAYAATLERYRERHVEGATPRADPIGSMPLHAIVLEAQEAGMTVPLAHLEYEPARYPSPEKYAEHVSAYGYDMFVGCVQAGDQESFWEDVVKAFSDAAPDSDGYLHDQYMNYLILDNS